MGFCVDQVELNYMHNSVTDSLADRYMDGSLAVVGDPLPKEVDEESWTRTPRSRQ